MRLHESSHLGEPGKERVAIIGISMGNSQFTQEYLEEIFAHLREVYGGIGIMLPDTPAEYTLQALGYSEKEAKQKARSAFNLIVNKCRRAIDKLEIEEVKLIAWSKREGSVGRGGREVILIDDLNHNEHYQDSYQAIRDLYEHDENFREDLREATARVLNGKKRKAGMELEEKSVDIGVEFLLQELAFIINAANVLDVPKTTYVYHMLMPILQKFYEKEYLLVPPSNTGYAVYR